MSNLLSKLFMTFVVKNWKSTVTGILQLVVYKFSPWLVAHGIDPMALHASLLALLGLVSKDADKSNSPAPSSGAGSVFSEPDPLSQGG